jgi:hypothetical protein
MFSPFPRFDFAGRKLGFAGADVKETDHPSAKKTPEAPDLPVD